MTGRGRRTRLDCSEYLIGAAESDVPVGKLPTRGEVLQVTCWHRKQDYPLPLSCPLISGSKSTSCFTPGGCSSETGGEKCTVAKVLTRWKEAGIKSLGDFYVRKRIQNLHDQYQKVKKKRNLNTPGAINERKNLKLDDCFDISFEASG